MACERLRSIIVNIPIIRNNPTRQWIALMLVVVVVVEVGRIAWDRYLAWLRGPMGPVGILYLGCPFLAICIIGLTVSLILMLMSIYYVKNVWPSSVLILGVFLVFQIPLPARPPTPEESHFLAYQDDYEHVVELARQHQLSNCPGGYAPPAQYRHVSAAECLTVYSKSPQGLVVGFSPFVAYYYQVVYIENRVSSDNFSCYSDLTIEKRIDDHWFICIGEWN